MAPEALVGIGLLAILAIVLAVMLARTRGQRESLRARVETLAPYQAIPNAEAEAERLTTAANLQADQTVAAAKQTAAATTSAANDEAARVVGAAQFKVDRLAAEASTLLGEAEREAAQILSNANQQAEAIAGDALQARREADDYKRAARAMKNVVEGYGDQYLVPTQSLLDELAAEFGHKEAGQELAHSRERTRRMVLGGEAAECDYKETKRRATAIRFVVDAFNGKVDSVLAKAKADNIGTLEQKIRDAFGLVNINGQAFKNARIRDEYREARLTEARWLVRTLELQKLEREEQRRIKQAMREEERARREYDKAIKQAEKEEKFLRKAMEKARRELEEAGQAERSRYQQELAELQTKLQEAEAKNERALSMAQQTRRGHVYVISNIGSFGEEVFKIGLTRRLEPKDRVKELGDASVPFEFDVHAMIFSEDAPALEKEIHRKFAHRQVNKVNPRKEFFRLRLLDVKKTVEKLGIDVHWTLAAEAREYRESLAIARQAGEAPSLLGREPPTTAAQQLQPQRP